MHRATIPALLAAALCTGAFPAFADPQEAEVRPAERKAVARHDDNVWGKGQVLPAEHRRSEVDEDELARYFLRPAQDGYRWVRVERGVYRVREENGRIEEAVFGLPVK